MMRLYLLVILIYDTMGLLPSVHGQSPNMSLSSFAYSGLAFGQTLCLVVYLPYVNVEGKSSRTYSLEDMGTFPFSHAFLLGQEELLVSLLSIGSLAYCGGTNEHSDSFTGSLDLS